MLQVLRREASLKALTADAHLRDLAQQLAQELKQQRAREQQLQHAEHQLRAGEPFFPPSHAR